MNAEVKLCKEEVIYANIILHLYTSFSSVKFWFLKLEALLWRPFFTHSKSIYLLDDLALFPLRNVWLYPWQCSLLWSLFCLIFSSVQSLSHVRLFATPWSSPPCPSTPGVHSNSCSLSQWCHPTISSSVIPFSSCLQCFPSSGSFKMSQFITLGGQSIGVSASASVLPMNIQVWFPLGWTGWISWQSKGLSRVFSKTTVEKHQFFGAQLFIWSNSHIHTWLLEKS